MSNFITELSIENFKSIRHLKMSCKRINLLIGKPNVGKSNILEALSLYCAPYNFKSKFLSAFIRYEKTSNLFYDQDVHNNGPIFIKSNIGFVRLSSVENYPYFEMVITSDEKVFLQLKEHEHDTFDKRKEIVVNYPIDRKAIISQYYHVFSQEGKGISGVKDYHLPIVKKYDYRASNVSADDYSKFLKPSNGENLFSIIQAHSELRKIVATYFKEYGLDFVLDFITNEIVIQKKVDELAYSIPYALVADTLRRMIFYNAAIISNENSILIFEEPETHSFPPYVNELAQRIVDSTSNQFFISTHSPYLLHKIIQETKDEDLNIGVVYYEDYETKIKVLSEEEIAEIQDSGLDVFFNLNWFVNE